MQQLTSKIPSPDNPIRIAGGGSKDEPWSAAPAILSSSRSLDIIDMLLLVDVFEKL